MASMLVRSAALAEILVKKTAPKVAINLIITQIFLKFVRYTIM